MNTIFDTISPLILHRGASMLAPENTLPAIEAAAKHAPGMWIELDVRLTACKTPVLMHDPQLGRNIEGQGWVGLTLYDDLKERDAGSWFSSAFAGTRVPTLKEALEVVLDLDIGLNLEFKMDFGHDWEAPQIMLEELLSIWPKDNPKLLLSSFNIPAVETSRQLAPQIPIGLCIEALPLNNKAVVDQYDLSSLHCNYDFLLHESTAPRIKTACVPVTAATVNDVGKARALLDSGVASIFTDHHDLLST